MKPDVLDDLRPILGAIARHWRRLHPADLTAPEALRLLGLLTEITDRLDAPTSLFTVDREKTDRPTPALRLVRDDDRPNT